MSKFITALEKDNNKGYTENRAVTNVSSLSNCVDLFGTIGSVRSRTFAKKVQIFTRAFSEDQLKALKILFWARDVRGGAGERQTFRDIIKYLGINYPDVIRKNLSLIPEYGRWDDLFVLEKSPVWNDVLAYIKETIGNDWKNRESNNITLLAKWMPSNNASSEKTKRLAKVFEKYLKCSPKQYRKMLSVLRSKIKIVEKNMCSNDWSSITYENIPSRASMIYRNAFKKHDEMRYTQYLDDVASGKKEIKTATLYPYDIIRNILGDGYSSLNTDKTLQLQWDNLPNYVEPFNGLVVCDVSASMYSCSSTVRPIDVAISLAIYIAERNNNAWKDKFLTFSDDSSLQKLSGNNIFEKVSCLRDAEWGMSTNIQSSFDSILKTAITNKIHNDDMPKTLFIVSDMEFNYCGSRTNFDIIKNKFHSNGYELPTLVWWNVDSRNDNFPVTIHDNGTCLVSGCSPSILKSVLNSEVITPVDIMNQTIESDRYSEIKI